MRHPPTLTVQFCQSGSVRVGLFHRNIVKPELLIGLFSSVAHVLILVKSDGRAPAVPSQSLTIRRLCPPCAVPRGSQQLCCSSVPGWHVCSYRGVELGFLSLQASEFPHLLWGWDLSSFKCLLAFWGGCACKCPGWLWIAFCCTPREPNVGYSLWSIPASQLPLPLSTPSPQSKKLQDSFIHQWFPCLLPTSFSLHPSLHLNVPGFPMQSNSGS